MSVTDRIAALTPEQRALFERLREAQQKAAPRRFQPPPLQRSAGPRDRGFPLSYAQQRLWFLQQLDPRSPAYNLVVGIRLSGALDMAAFAGALDEVVRRHESLRTSFPVAGSQPLHQPLQLIAPPERTELARIDLSALPATARERELRRVLEEMSARPFDLESGAPLRTALLRLAATEHVLLAVLHHIIADAWSGGVLVQEVGAVYLATVQGRPAFLPALPVQYADYAVWQRSWLTGEVLQAELDWWRERLAGAPPRIELPTDHPRLGAGRRAGKLLTHLPAELAQRLAQLGQREGATLFMVLMAAYQLLIGRLSHQDDLPVATVVANRLQPEIEPLIGFFVNTLVVRGRLSAEDSFRDLLLRTRAEMIAVTEHQEVSFEQVVEAVRPERAPGETPFFQTLFVLQNAPSQEADLPGLRFSGETAESGEAKLDLALQLSDTPEGLAGEWEYRADLFDAATVARLAEQLRTLLEAAVGKPDRNAFALPLLSAAESHQALIEWNEDAATLLEERPVHLAIAAVAAAHSERTALVFPGGVWSYGDLQARTAALAGRLRKRGVGPERIVALCAERSPEMILGLLAVLAAGGAYLPFDPRYPAERLRFLWEDAGRPLLLAPEALLPALPAEVQERWEPLAVPVEHLAAPSSEDGDAADVDGEHPAYVYYTSGSTGQPKGILIPHRQLRRRIEGLARRLGIGPGSRVLQLSAFPFDGSVAEIFSALTQGAELHLLAPEEALPGPSLVRALRERRITAAFATPQHLLTTPAEELPDLVRIIIGGDTMPPELIGLWGPERVINGYGPTEATVIATLGFGARPGDKPPIGRPLPGTRAVLLDPRGEPVPIGSAGELWLAGAGLARGYLGRPDLTADRFRPDPFGGFWEEPGARMYRTGDLVRRLADGRLDFLGRADAQVKIRGFRIEPGEIETVLLAHPWVGEAVVVARDDWGGEARLVAYCTPAAAGAGEASLPSVLRAHLAGLLPGAMVPAAIVILPELPLNLNDKVDRTRLPLPSELAAADADGGAPHTPAEELVAGVWADLLDLPRVGRLADFFVLGGHSLLATRVVSRLREAAGVELPVRALFTAPTVASLALALEAALAAGSGEVAAPPLRPEPRDRPLPLSFAQERLWFLDRLAPGGTAYTIPLILAAHGDLSLPALESALSEMVRRHEALRTTYAAAGDRPVQIIETSAAAAGWVLPLTDLSGLSPAPRAKEARRLADEAVARPFDLESGPVLRAAAVRLDAAEHVLLLTVHHIAADGWSMGVMVEEIAALYRGAPLPELAVQYADFAVWQREWLRGAVLDRQLAFWRGELAGAPALDLPTDRPRPPVQSFRGAARTHTLGAATARALAGLARRTDATLFMVLLAAVQALLGRHAGQDDVVVGSPIANRTRAETEPLIGFFVNTLVLRGDLSGDPPFTGLLARARRLALNAYAHQDLPFERLVEELRPDRRLAGNPLFQVMFAVQNAPLREIALPGLTFAAVDFDVPATRFDLEIFFTEVADGLSVQLTWSTDLFDETTVLRLTEHLEVLLSAVLEDPDRRLSEIELLAPAERHQLLAEWNDTASELPSEDVFSLFAAQARRRPGAVALTSGAGDVTYAELHAHAVRLARRLAAAGVGPEVRVALLAPRSPALIAGLLGILAAGGAYVPLDPSHPAERLAWMLADSGARVLLAPRELLAAVPDNAAPVLIELGFDLGEDAAAPSDLPSALPPDALAYVMYTSGSTGRPKGVGVTHRNIVRLVRESGFADLGAEQVFLQLAPVSFDASTLEIWAPLLHGGRLAIFPPRRPSLEELGEAIARWGVTTLWLTAGLFHEMVDGNLEGLRPLRQLLAGGDVLSPSHVQSVLAGLPGLTLINGYGPTEATTFVSCHRMTEPGDPGGTVPSVPIGRPIGKTRLHVLDGAGRPVPIGVRGELCAGGEGISRGYLGRPDLTAERFLPDPFSGLPGERLYRTGDIVRHRPDGRLEILGRRDGQIKLRGFRIELGEIEGALARHPWVRAAVVTARDDGGPVGRRLVAYAVPVHSHGDAPPLVPELRRFLEAELPDYMVPAAFVILDALPLTANGKVDRAALPAPEISGPAAASLVAPSTPLEKLIAGVTAEILGIERAGLQDNFFALGGHSLLATQLASRLTREHGVALSLQMIFDAPTLGDLADRIVEQELAAADSGLLDEMLGTMEGLSAEELRALLTVGGEGDRK